eukprot:gene8905-biopygen8024
MPLPIHRVRNRDAGGWQLCWRARVRRRSSGPPACLLATPAPRRFRRRGRSCRVVAATAALASVDGEGAATVAAAFADIAPIAAVCAAVVAVVAAPARAGRIGGLWRVASCVRRFCWGGGRSPAPLCASAGRHDRGAGARRRRAAPARRADTEGRGGCGRQHKHKVGDWFHQLSEAGRRGGAARGQAAPSANHPAQQQQQQQGGRQAPAGIRTKIPGAKS